MHQVSTQAPTFTVAWHPRKHLLAYACDDKVSFACVVCLDRFLIMEYGGTPYIGMVWEEMAAALNVYKMMCSSFYEPYLSFLSVSSGIRL